MSKRDIIIIRTQSMETYDSLIKGSVARNKFVALCLQKMLRMPAYQRYLDFRIFT